MHCESYSRSAFIAIRMLEKCLVLYENEAKLETAWNNKVFSTLLLKKICKHKFLSQLIPTPPGYASEIFEL